MNKRIITGIIGSIHAVQEFYAIAIIFSLMYI